MKHGGQWRFVLVVCVVVAVPAAARADQRLTILHTNDMHGDLMALARVAAVVERIRADTPDVLLLDAGDFSHENRSAEHVRRGQALMPYLMARIGYDAATPGNHDMDQAVVRANLASVRFPLLYANPTAEALTKGRVRTVPFIVKKVGRVNVGILGLTVNGAPAAARAQQVIPQMRAAAAAHPPPETLSLPGRGLGEGRRPSEPSVGAPHPLPEGERDSSPPTAGAPQLPGPAAARRGADVGPPHVIVALTHQGLTADEDLARQVPGIALIVGGHWHIDLQPPRMVGQTAIVCAGGHGEFVGSTTLRLDEAKRVTAVTGKLISLWEPGVAPSPAILRSISPQLVYVSGKGTRFGDVLGEAVEPFVGRRSDLETALGNLAADVLREKFGTEAAFLRGNVLSPQLAKGPITVGDLYHVIRWDAPSVTMTLRGDLLRQVLEHSLDDDPHFRLRMSGVRLRYDPARPQGERLVTAEVAGGPLDPSRDYRVAVEDWLANGSAGYTWFTKATQVKRSGPDVRDLLIEHVRKVKTIQPAPLDRFVSVAASKAAA